MNEVGRVDQRAVERTICIVVHDVAPATWSACQWLLERVARHGDFAVTLLAVPRYHGQPRSAGFERWLRERVKGGDEVALHGFDHLDGGAPSNPLDRLRRRVYTRGEGEFAALSFEQATQRIGWGRDWLHELGIRPAGFVAPAWLLGGPAWSALRAQPFRYTCTLRRIHLLGAGRGTRPPRSITCQSQVYSSATVARQRLSVLWNETLAWSQRTAPLVRMELHPSDDVPAVARSWEGLLQRQAATRRALTLQQLAERLRQ